MSTRTKPTVGLSMIVGGTAFRPDGMGPGDLAKCLASVRSVGFDQVVIVDTGIGDEGKRVLEAESRWREEQGLTAIEVPVFVWVDDFAAARNEGLKHLKTDWFLWADHDDTVENPEAIRTLIEEVNDDTEVGGFWLPYRYAFDEYGNCTTLHDRERLLRLSVGWHWERRIHEVLSPHRGCQWLKEQRVILNHVRGHESHSERNIALLLKMLEDEPEDIRVWKDLGNQYFSNGEWPKAVKWYEKYVVDRRGVQMERWQCICYMARAYREMEKYEAAIHWDNLAMLAIPTWNDAYLGLAQTYALMEDWEKVQYWAEESRHKELPSRILFLNPLECQIMAAKLLEKAYGNQNNYDKAIEECDTYLEIRPNDTEIKDDRATWVKNRTLQKDIDSFKAASHILSSQEIIDLSDRLDGLKGTSQVRDVLMPAFLRRTELGTQPKVTFFCGNSQDFWYPGVAEERGIGGSETAAIEIAKRFHSAGWDVSVYNNCGQREGEYDGVVYYDYRRWAGRGKPDLFVSWRHPIIATDQRCNAHEKWLWLHNVYAPQMKESWESYDRILGVSQAHVEMSQAAYPFIAPDKFGFVYNGVNLDRFKPEVMPVREPYKLVWTSSPDRGLVHLLKMWPEIIKHVPDATLHIFYGWGAIDRLIEAGDKEAVRLKQETMAQAIQPGLVWHGRVSQRQLALELLSAQVWPYSCTWDEEFCINALEAMAAGVFPVTSDLGALPEVMGDVGYRVPIRENFKPTNKKWRHAFVGIVLAGLLDETEGKKFRETGPARAAIFTWDRAFEKSWKPKLRMPVEV